MAMQRWALADVSHVLIDQQTLADRVRELGEAISRDYEGREIRAVAVLKGAVIFLADLSRYLSVPVSFDFMAITSYGHSTETSGVVRIIKDLDESIEDRHVLIVEDIVDTGLTLKYLLEILETRQPASLRVCTLLDKAGRRRAPVPIHYRGFSIPNEFVVGYGLDRAGLYRNVPYIFVVREDAADGEAARGGGR
jgi:hypoxanthine phosphoribosyltransferase